MIKRAEPSDCRANGFTETGQRRPMDRDPRIVQIELAYLRVPDNGSRTPGSSVRACMVSVCL